MWGMASMLSQAVDNPSINLYFLLVHTSKSVRGASSEFSPFSVSMCTAPYMHMAFWIFRTISEVSKPQ